MHIHPVHEEKKREEERERTKEKEGREEKKMQIGRHLGIAPRRFGNSGEVFIQRTTMHATMLHLGRHGREKRDWREMERVREKKSEVGRMRFRDREAEASLQIRLADLAHIHPHTPYIHT